MKRHHSWEYCKFFTRYAIFAISKRKLFFRDIANFSLLKFSRCAKIGTVYRDAAYEQLQNAILYSQNKVNELLFEQINLKRSLLEMKQGLIDNLEKLKQAEMRLEAQREELRRMR